MCVCISLYFTNPQMHNLISSENERAIYIYFWYFMYYPFSFCLSDGCIFSFVHKCFVEILFFVF